MKRKLLGLILILTMVLSCSVNISFAEENEDKPARTIMLYVCGADLETDSSMATFNLLQILKARFSKDGNVRFIIMTGGSNKWQLEDSYLKFPENVVVPNDAISTEDPSDPDASEGDDEGYDPANNKSGISNVYNQIWEAKGLDAAEDPGKMVLIDGDGISGDGETAKKSEDELMSKPETLKAFINYCHDNYPADKYDLILWDHGGGPTGGFGVDQHDEDEKTMPFAGLVEAIKDNKVTDRDSDGTQDGRFDFIDFDACLMSSVELTLAFAKYTDYYIASPETEPGYGQDYEGWLNMAGEEPNVSTYDLGKKIVDDFYDFYETGYGKEQDGTLAIFNTKRLLNSDLIPALNVMTDKLIRELTVVSDKMDLLAYYDELYSGKNAISYGSISSFRDLGNLASLLGVSSYETTLEDVEDGTDNIRNTHSITSEWFDDILGDKKMMYAKGTSGITTEDIKMIRKRSGIEFDKLKTSGMYIFFPTSDGLIDTGGYYKAMNEVLQVLDEKDESTKFLKKYLQVITRYELMIRTGKTVESLIEPNELDKAITIEGIELPLKKNEVTYDTVKKFWTASIEDVGSLWDTNIKRLFDNLEGGEDGAREWLEVLIKQQAGEAVEKSKVTAKKIQTKNGDEYQVTIDETGRRVIDSVKQNVVAKLPVLEAYKQEVIDHGTEIEKNLLPLARLSIGSIDATVDFDVDLTKTGDDLVKEVIKWNLGNVSKWNFEPLPDKWYAVKNADGEYPVASIYTQTNDAIIVSTQNEDGGLMLLAFAKDDGSLESLAAVQANGGMREIVPEDIVGELTLKPVVYVSLFGMVEKFYPISQYDIKVTSQNYKNIKLLYTDISEIDDIEELDSTTTIRNIYGDEIDITDIVKDPEIKTVTGIDRAEIIDSTYSKSHEGEFLPTFKLDGKTLTEGTDYKFVLRDKLVKPGEYYLTIEGIGEYGGTCFFEYMIKKGANPLKVKAKTFKIKSSSLKKRSRTVKRSKVIKTVTTGAGIVTYKKTSGNKKITINKKTGKVTLKKGLKKGTYKVKVTVKAAGNSYYKAKTQKLTLKIRVR